MNRFIIFFILIFSFSFSKAQDNGVKIVSDNVQDNEVEILFDNSRVFSGSGIVPDNFKDSIKLKKCNLSIRFSDTSIVIRKYQLARGNRPITDPADIIDPLNINLKNLVFQAYSGDRIIFYTSEDVYDSKSKQTTRIVTIKLDIPIR